MLNKILVIVGLLGVIYSVSSEPIKKGTITNLCNNLQNACNQGLESACSAYASTGCNCNESTGVCSRGNY